MSKLSENDQMTLKKVEDKSAVSTAGKRDAFVIYQINKKERVTTSAEIFRKCAHFRYLEGENDFASKELASMKS